MEQTLVLGAADVGHVTCEDAVQSSAVSDRGDVMSQFIIIFHNVAASRLRSSHTHLDSNSRTRGSRRWSRADVSSSSV